MGTHASTLERLSDILVISCLTLPPPPWNTKSLWICAPPPPCDAEDGTTRSASSEVAGYQVDPLEWAPLTPELGENATYPFDESSFFAQSMGFIAASLNSYSGWSTRESTNNHIVTSYDWYCNGFTSSYFDDGLTPHPSCEENQCVARAAGAAESGE